MDTSTIDTDTDMNQPANVINDADPTAMTIKQASALILKCLRPLSTHESLPVIEALGRHSAKQIVATQDVPPFRASAMDGFALRVSECSKELRIEGKSLAGHPGENSLAAYTAQRVMTGAKVPDDADAVVQQENTTVIDGKLKINETPIKEQHIRMPGSGIKAGSTLLLPGERIGPAAVALLCANGVGQIRVQTRLKIAVFSTGDELVNPGDPLSEGQIYDSNRALLLSMLEDQSVELIDLGIVADTELGVSEAFEAARDADLVISSGGVSVGEADYVKKVVSTMGKVNLWKVAMKPGRPLTFGELGGNRSFFGLPGNPVSAAITCLLFVKPAIEHLCGSAHREIPSLTLPLRGKLNKNPGRVEYQRAILEKNANNDWIATTTGLQDSHVLMSLQQANCLIELPTNSTGAEDGELVTVIPFEHFGRGPL